MNIESKPLGEISASILEDAIGRLSKCLAESREEFRLALEKITTLEADIDRWKEVAEDCALAKTKVEACAIFEAALFSENNGKQE